NPSEECRFILLGGDDYAKKEVCSFMLRNQQNQQRTDLEDWEVKENRVQGRHVTVAISPSSWLESLRSSFFLFRGISKLEKVIKKCLSAVFPGPTAFLLVIRDGRDIGKEHYLLKAGASVFGKEALDYSMVLLVRGSGQKRSDPASMKCVKKCGERYQLLEDTERSVQELFSKVLKMVGDKKRKFFIPPSYEDFMETEFESWEKNRILHMNTFLAKHQEEKDKLIEELRTELDALQLSETSRSKESSLRKELDTSKLREDHLKMELNASQQRESKLRKQVNDYESENSKLRKEWDASKSRENKLRKNYEVLQIRETELKKDLDASKKSESELKKELDASKKSESELKKVLDASKRSESELKKELDASKKSESELKKVLDASKRSESELKKELDASKRSESELKKVLDASKKSESELKKVLDASKRSESELKKVLDASKKSESELKKELEATQQRETKLIKDLDDFRRDECNPGRLLDPPQQRESEVRKEDCGVEKHNTEQEPEPSGTRKRRGSKDIDPPNSHYFF
ncbi:hypothetical protein QTP70_032191, partial [Hemibagrus guttatus]